jgi:hypothetical protein
MSGRGNYGPLFVYNWDKSIASVPTDWHIWREAVIVQLQIPIAVRHSVTIPKFLHLALVFCDGPSGRAV